MTFWKQISWVRTICCVIVAFSLAFLFARPQIRYASSSFNGKHSPIGFITREVTVSQYFTCESENLKGIALTVATYCRINHSQLIWKLKDVVSNTVLCQKIFDASKIADNSLQYMAINVPVHSGQKLCLEISSPDAGPANAVTVYCYPANAKSGKMLINQTIQSNVALDLQCGYYRGSWMCFIGVFLAIFFILSALQIWDAVQKNQKMLQTALVTNTTKSGKKPFDWGMHYFRAFAILCIVIGHYTPVYSSLFVGDSIFFLFISGYLCQMLAPRGSISSYYQKKVQNVVCPYLVMTTFSLLLLLHVGSLAGLYNGEISWSNVPLIYLIGQAHTPYWYMPFIIGIFAFSPLFYNAKGTTLGGFVLLTGIFFLLFPYRYDIIQDKTICFFRNYSYFTVFYLFGMLYFRYRDKFDFFFKKTWWLFFALALFCHYLILHNCILWGMSCSSGILLAFHKLFLIPCVILLLNFLQNKKIWLLDQVAKYSFSLYFLHCFFLQTFQQSAMPWMSAHLPHAPLWAIFCVLMPVWLGGMLLISMVLKCAFGKHSRMIMGA